MATEPGCPLSDRKPHHRTHSVWHTRSRRLPCRHSRSGFQIPSNRPLKGTWSVHAPSGSGRSRVRDVCTLWNAWSRPAGFLLPSKWLFPGISHPLPFPVALGHRANRRFDRGARDRLQARCPWREGPALRVWKKKRPPGEAASWGWSAQPKGFGLGVSLVEGGRMGSLKSGCLPVRVFRKATILAISSLL